MNDKLNLEKFASTELAGSILEHSPEVWQAWLAELPLMNIGKSARLIHHALYEINLHHPIDYNNWQLILEQFRPAVASIQANVTETFLAVETQPLSKKLAIFGLIQNLQLSLIESYSQLIYVLYNSEDKSCHQTLGLAIHRCINYLSEILLQCFQVYTIAPKGLWAKLHKMYQIANEVKLTDFFARHEIDLDSANKISIKTGYQRALLLSLANLYQLDFADMQRIYHVLGQWAVKSQLRQDPTDSYYIYLNKDEPPIAQKLIQEPDPFAPWLSLDLTLLVAFIERLANHLESNTDSNVTPTLLQHMLRNWGNTPTRAFPRIKQHAEMRVCLGLSAIHYHISANLETTPELPIKEKNPADDLLASLTLEEKKAPTPILIPGILNNLPAEPDVWQPDFLLNKQAEDEEIKASAANIKPRYTTYDWRVIDSSPTGYGLYSTSNWPETIKVGELIGLQQREQRIVNHWFIGVIRWIRQTGEGELLLGIQLLTMTASPVRIDALNDIANKTLRALFIPQIDSESPQTIITPNLQYPLNTQIRIYNGNNTYEVSFTKQINQDVHFKWFEFTMI